MLGIKIVDQERRLSVLAAGRACRLIDQEGAAVSNPIEEPVRTVFGCQAEGVGVELPRPLKIGCRGLDRLWNEHS